MHYRLRKPAALKHPSTGVLLAPRLGELFEADDPLVLAHPKAFKPAEREDEPDGTG